MLSKRLFVTKHKTQKTSEKTHAKPKHVQNTSDLKKIIRFASLKPRNPLPVYTCTRPSGDHFLGPSAIIQSRTRVAEDFWARQQHVVVQLAGIEAEEHLLRQSVVVAEAKQREVRAQREQRCPRPSGCGVDPT